MVPPQGLERLRPEGQRILSLPGYRLTSWYNVCFSPRTCVCVRNCVCFQGLRCRDFGAAGDVVQGSQRVLPVILIPGLGPVRSAALHENRPCIRAGFLRRSRAPGWCGRSVTLANGPSSPQLDRLSTQSPYCRPTLSFPALPA